ncbi:MAG TPA: hypothetical protein VNB24_02875 [Acidimicrobiales bacterium]|nr:hypothetical protein [Acidimicrobiales bacterium]
MVLTLATLDRAAVGRGALGVVMFVAPVVALTIALAGGDESSSAWLLVAAAVLFAATFGGYVAAHDRPVTPMAHGAAAAAVGLSVCFVVALAVQAAQGDLTLAATFTAVVFVQIGAALGCLGALLAVKGLRRGVRS